MPHHEPVRIIHAHEAPWLEPARAIFAEYAASIADVAACSLQHQHFDAELAGLPGAYAPPTGCMLLALSPADEILGCIAMRPLPTLGQEVCELKRMYVRQGARRRGIGRLLAQRVLDEARAAEYLLMKLDTSDTMHAAQALYRALGFVPCERYNDDPMSDTLWFERRLDGR